MSVDGTDLSKVTGEALKATVEAAAVAAAPRAGWFLSRLAAAVLAVVLPLLGGVVGFVTGRSTVAPAAVEAPAGSGSGSASLAAPAASGSAASEGTAATVIPYDAKMVAADAVLGTPNGTGEAAHAAHPADAAAVEADAK